jgi:hypothetical protein
VFAKVEAKAGVTPGVTRRPDVVCFLPDSGEEAIDTILELKLLLNDEKPTSAIDDLKLQMVNARELAPNAKVLGLLFLAAAPFLTPGKFERATVAAKSESERILSNAEGFGWVSGHEFAHVFRGVYTDFHYPSMAVSLALAVRELGSRTSQDLHSR